MNFSNSEIFFFFFYKSCSICQTLLWLLYEMLLLHISSIYCYDYTTYYLLLFALFRWTYFFALVLAFELTCLLTFQLYIRAKNSLIRFFYLDLFSTSIPILFPLLFLYTSPKYHLKNGVMALQKANMLANLQAFLFYIGSAIRCVFTADISSRLVVRSVIFGICVLMNDWLLSVSAPPIFWEYFCLFLLKTSAYRPLSVIYLVKLNSYIFLVQWSNSSIFIMMYRI